MIIHNISKLNEVENRRNSNKSPFMHWEMKGKTTCWFFFDTKTYFTWSNFTQKNFFADFSFFFSLSHSRYLCIHLYLFIFSIATEEMRKCKKIPITQHKHFGPSYLQSHCIPIMRTRLGWRNSQFFRNISALMFERKKIEFSHDEREEEKKNFSTLRIGCVRKKDRKTTDKGRNC